jgi:hypothetical protein
MWAMTTTAPPQIPPLHPILEPARPENVSREALRTLGADIRKRPKPWPSIR